MKKILLSLSLTFSSLSFLMSQDLIVTQENDSLNCRISKVKSDFIYFTFMYNGEIRKTLIPLFQVKDYQQNFYESALLPAEVGASGNFQKVRIGFFAGPGFMTAKLYPGIPPFLREYTKELKSGMHYSGDITFFLSENVGLGASYSLFKSSNILKSVIAVDPVNGEEHVGNISDDLELQFYAPVLAARMPFAKDIINFNADVAFGYLAYKNEQVFIQEAYTLTGGTLGFMFGLGFDFSVSKNIALGVGAKYIAGVISKFELLDHASGTSRTIELPEDQYENVSRIDLAVGLRFDF